ncbi:MAG: hypothetical protein HZB67_04515 [Candidatus Aenigmarchaeota archaeon]|nr:hypothetical protein [Candidatus Aenigmarchaeota archaeon]
MFSSFHDSRRNEYFLMQKEMSLRFSKDMIGRPVIDRFGFKIGKVRDVAIPLSSFKEPYPTVAGFMVEKKFIKWGMIAKLGKHLTLKESLRKGDICPIPRDQMFVGKKLLDEQLLDMQGKSIGRVDDIRLVYDATGSILKVAGLYSGASALLMRIGIDIYGNVIPWSCIEKIRENPSGIVLRFQGKSMPVSDKYMLYEAGRLN